MCLEDAQKGEGFVSKVIYTSHGSLVVFRAPESVMGPKWEVRRAS